MKLDRPPYKLHKLFEGLAFVICLQDFIFLMPFMLCDLQSKLRHSLREKKKNLLPYKSF